MCSSCPSPHLRSTYIASTTHASDHCLGRTVWGRGADGCSSKTTRLAVVRSIASARRPGGFFLRPTGDKVTEILLYRQTIEVLLYMETVMEVRETDRGRRKFYRLTPVSQPKRVPVTIDTASKWHLRTEILRTDSTDSVEVAVQNALQSTYWQTKASATFLLTSRRRNPPTTAHLSSYV